LDFSIAKEENPNIRRCEKVLTEVKKYQIDKVKEKSGRENRNRTCFVYAGFLLHLNSYEMAYEKLKEFNNFYRKPLSNNRIKTILDYCNENHYKEEKKKYLYMTNSSILDLLEVNSGDYNIISTPGFKYSDIYKKSKLSPKEKSKEKRNRNKLVVNMLKQGKTYEEIAKIMDISVSTISRIAKPKSLNKIKIKDEQPWVNLGISRATYYRKYK
jgi:hypothetical protein